VRRRPAVTSPPPVAPELDHEELVVRRGRRSGVHTVLAVHSTALGPALGGCRMWRYPGVAQAIDDALRLSRTMTHKAAAAGLDLGGGKGVICLRAGDQLDAEGRERVLLDFADAVEGLGGRYITAEDVGTSARDMVTIARGTRHVVGLPVELGGGGDPSPFTAAGVVAAMRACCAHRLGSAELAGLRVAVVGCGRVGERVARRLAAAGVDLVLADVDPAKRALADELGAQWLEPGAAPFVDVDVLAPCALGGLIDDAAVARLRCRIVCGAANNPLAHEGVADALAERDILYAPDFIVNAGGLINVWMELGDYDAEHALRRVREIEVSTARVLAVAAATGTTPLAAAKALADARLRAAA
jgi:leucine dehydrogenase